MKILNKNKRMPLWLNILLIVVPLFCVIISLLAGRYFISPLEVWKTLFSPSFGEAPTTVVMELRLPRSLAAAFVGASLAVSGAAYQGVFRNPLVNSSLLGVSQGAGFGASLAIVALGGGAVLYPCSFIFAVMAVGLSILAGRIAKSNTNVTLILGGTIVSAFFGALTSILKYMADPYSQLPSITFWFMGSFASVGSIHLVAIIPMVIGMGLIFLCRWKINVLSMGDREAATLGLNTGFYKLLLIGGATLCTTAAVCISGVIGWVGLVIPHIGRMLVGNDNNRLIPVSISLGAAFMVIIDILARNLTASELPIGILTALVGTPFFVYLLKKTKGGVWR
ncbi:MAG: iron ABC transporter permease [Firmicutes bacterium]|nr:iron ABC transporter permease [Bacillota bacterium]